MVNIDLMPFEFDMVSDDHIKREKEKARSLRRTHWWQNKLQKGACYYCSREVGRKQLTMDHVVPLGGEAKSEGKYPCSCKECNTKKKYLLPIKWNSIFKTLAEGM